MAHSATELLPGSLIDITSPITMRQLKYLAVVTGGGLWLLNSSHTAQKKRRKTVIGEWSELSDIGGNPSALAENFLRETYTNILKVLDIWYVFGSSSAEADQYGDSAKHKNGSSPQIAWTNEPLQ